MSERHPLVAGTFRAAARRLAFAACVMATSPVTSAADWVEPSPALSPAEVLEAQLSALANNDTPEPDAGIEATFALAHPANQAATGPIDRFADMLHGPQYGALINHSEHVVQEVSRLDRVVAFEVQVVAADGALWRYSWVLEQVVEGALAGCWLSTSVMPLGRDAGQPI